MSTRLPDKLTPLSADEAIKLLAQAYKIVTGRAPNKTILGMLAGQSSLESGNYRMVHNFNLGNDKWNGREPFYQQYGVGDDPSDPGAKYTAHQNALEGAVRYIQVLKGREHWWKGLQSKDPRTFITALSTPPVYFTANPTTYLVGFQKEISENAQVVAKYAAKSWPFVLAAGISAYAAYYLARKQAKG